MRLPEHGEAAPWDMHRAIIEQAQEAIICIDRAATATAWSGFGTAGAGMDRPNTAPMPESEWQLNRHI
jgi:F420-0:gamma-glutamyl ligase